MWFLLLLLTAHFEQVIPEDGDRLQLEHGGGPCEGYIRVYHGGERGHVGCQKWTDVNDKVVCKATNCGTRVRGSEETAIGPVIPVLLNELECTGKEENLWDCDHPGWKVNSYQKGTQRKIECSDKIKIGLEGFSCEGAVMYSRDNGTTYTGYICKDGFGEKEANKLCQDLNCGDFDKWNDWMDVDISGSNRTKINCPKDNKEIKNLWQCAPKNASCTVPASVICKGFKRLQLRGNSSNVCAGLLEQEENNKWSPANVKTSPKACEQMHCGSNGTDTDNGTKLTCSDNVKVVLMDNGKPSHCYGEVHIERNGVRQAVCASNWKAKEAQVVCSEQNCGALILHENKQSKQGGVMDKVECSGEESSLWHCRAKRGNNMKCSSIAYVICKESAEVRLMDGPGKCAGRVEIKHEGQWRKVESQGWTKTNSDTVCRLQRPDLKCGDKSKPNDPEKFSQGSTDFLNRIVTCPQNAKHISECIKGRSNNPSGTQKAVGITCEGHKVINLKGEKACAGMVGIEYAGETKWLSGSSTWTNDTANAVCRQKRCGEVNTFKSIPTDNKTKEVWGVSYNCSPDATSLFDCQEAPQQLDHNDTIAYVKCKGNISVSLANGCWGTVRACVDGKCGGICAATWTDEMSKLLCQSEGCGNAILKATQKPQEIQLRFKSLHSTKDKTNLNQCDFIEYDDKDASTCENKPAYVVCSGSVKPRFEPSRDKCSGNVQVLYEGKWLPVCAEALNSLQTRNTICEELQCGTADQEIAYFGPKLETGPFISKIECSGKGNESLTSCIISAKKDVCITGGLQCSSWKKMEVTKGKSDCSGAVHVLSKTDKKAVSLEGWTESEGDRFCQDLKCGNYKNKKPTYSEARQTTSFSCNLTGSSDPENIWECEHTTLPSSKQTLYVECEDGLSFSLSNQCHGDVMINNQMVCAKNWKDMYSTKVCNEFKCGSAIPGVISDKKATAKKEYYHVQCEENHHALGHCKTYKGECEGKLVSVSCAHNVSFRAANYCGGYLEINYQDNWEKVCTPSQFTSNLKDKLCAKINCTRHNNSIPENKEIKKTKLQTRLDCSDDNNDISYCVKHESCNAKPAQIYCDGYEPPITSKTEKQGPNLVAILLGVGFLLVLVILSIVFIRICILKKGKKAIHTSSRMLSRQEEEFGSGEFENIKENEMQDLSRGRFRSDAQVIMENDAPSTSSFPYDDIDEAQPLNPQTATPVSENNYINEDELHQSADGVTYEVEDPQENYDDIEAGPEITQTEAEVHHSPKTASEGDAAEPLGLVMGDDDYLVPGQDR